MVVNDSNYGIQFISIQRNLILLFRYPTQTVSFQTTVNPLLLAGDSLESLAKPFHLICFYWRRLCSVWYFVHLNRFFNAFKNILFHLSKLYRKLCPILDTGLFYFCWFFLVFIVFFYCYYFLVLMGKPKQKIV